MRYHPTQKPVEIMRWCIEMLPKRGGGWGNTVLDAYMSSGSTAVDAGVQLIGVEAAGRWFDVAVERVAAYLATRAG